MELELQPAVEIEPKKHLPCAKGCVIGCDCGGEDVPGRSSTARHAPSLTRGHRHPWLCRGGTITAGWKVAMWS